MDLTNEVISIIEDKYEIKRQNPWKKYPDFETISSIYSDKWFALFMKVDGKRIGLSEGEIYPIVNIKAEPEFIALISGSPGVLPAYHMNKTHWLSILLDGTLEADKVMSYIDMSYDLVVNTPTKRIYDAVRQIPRGKVATYGQIAAMAGNPKMSRAVGNALHKNPDEESIPCYRVVNSKGELSEAFVFGGINIQKQRLEADGIEVIGDRVDLGKFGI